MIDFELSEEQEMIRKVARDFAQNEIAPIAAEYDEREEHCPELVEKAFKAGMMHLNLPEEYGGQGMDTVTTVIVMEELNKACGGLAATLGVNILATYPILIGGSEEQKKEWLGWFTSGPHLAGFCLTEPGAGSDAGAVATTAVRDGDHYVLNGVKHFITNGGIADMYTVFASTDRSQGVRGITAFIVKADTPGISSPKKEHKMGVRASVTGEVVFEDCRVPVENRLDEEGEGFKIAMKTLDRARVSIAAAALGIAQAALDAATEYAKTRVQFGRPIGKFQAIQFKLADMAMEIKAARMLTWYAAWAVDNDAPDITGAGAMSKCYAADVGMRVTTEAVQIFGGYGYMREYPVEKYMRDAKIQQLWEGTNEIQRLVIARELLR